MRVLYLSLIFYRLIELTEACCSHETQYTSGSTNPCYAMYNLRSFDPNRIDLSEY